MDIEKIDIEGEPENVCTEYDVHTVALVKGPALGVNITKTKADNELETEEMKILTDRVNKAKAKDEEKSNKSEVENTETKEEKVKSVEKEEETNIDKPKADKEKSVEIDKEKSGDEVTDEVISDEKSKSVEDDNDLDISDDKSKSVDSKDDEISTEEAVTDKEVKSKTFSVEEFSNAQKSALEAIHALFIKVKSEAPDADPWEVYNLIHDSVLVVDDILWWEAQERMDELWEEVWAEVSSRVDKAKALKVSEATTKEEAIKAFQLANPDMAKILLAELEEVKEKAIIADNEKAEIIRSKKLEVGSNIYKRIATKDNTTDKIVDALSAIELVDQESHNIVSKALEVASNIIMAGKLFPDVGSSESLQVQTEKEYTDEKSKSIIEEDSNIDIATARANVRQSQEFMQLYR